MIEPPTVTLPAGWTNAPYVQAIRFPGQDLTGATFLMQVRQYPGAEGDPEVAFHIDFAVATLPDGVALTVLTVSLSEAQMAALPMTGEAGASTTFSFDLVCTPANGIKSVLLAGTFPVRQGVTR